MRTCTLLAVLLAFVPVYAQFYAPETDYHDPCQRRFPVEAARVLASARPGEIDEVIYRIETGRGGETTWRIEWRAEGSAKRNATVRYPQSALLTGPQWYRDVWQQLTGEDWGAVAGGRVADEFWQGAKGAGISRMEALGAALAQTKKGVPARAEEAARLAGTLTHAALPLAGSTTSFDSIILARAAAWLCMAEEQAGARRTAEWAPILALAGRHGDAKRAWPELAGAATPLLRFWDLMIRLPGPVEALTVIVRPENRVFAAPLFCAYGDIEPAYAPIFVELAQKLYPGDLWKRIHDYGPTLNWATNNREPIARDATRRIFRAIAGVLHQVAQEGSGPELRAKISELKKVVDKTSGDLDPPHPLLVDVLNAGAGATGPLSPVAVVTGPDLLSFAWEFGGVQLASLHDSYRVLGGLRERAKQLESGWFEAVKGWSPFTATLRDRFEPLAESGRYEGVVSAKIAAHLIEVPPESWQESAERETIYFRRRWLVDPHRALEFLILQNGKPETASAMLRRCVAEGGPRQIGGLVTMDNRALGRGSSARWVYDQGVDALKMREELLRAVPQSINGRRELLEREFEGVADSFRYAQELERLHWATGVAFAPQDVFISHVRARAYESANRFYDRWHEAMTNRYRFQEQLGPANYALAVLEGDAPRQQKALRDLDHSTLRIPEITAALLRNDLDDARKHIDAWLERFGRARGAPEFRKLREFLPLIAALNDPKHPDHGRALDSYPTESATLIFPQWVLLQRARLPVDSAVRFLGGDEAGEEAQLMIAAVRKDAKKFAALYDKLLGPREDRTRDTLWMETARRLPDAKGVLYVWARNQLLQKEVPRDQADVRPPNAIPLVLQLRAATSDVK